MLKGEALIEGNGGAEQSIISLSIAELPSDPCARFARLFALRPRWALPDLEPYLADLQVRPALALLRRHTPHYCGDSSSPGYLCRWAAWNHTVSALSLLAHKGPVCESPGMMCGAVVLAREHVLLFMKHASGVLHRAQQSSCPLWDVLKHERVG